MQEIAKYFRISIDYKLTWCDILFRGQPRATPMKKRIRGRRIYNV